MRPLRAVLVYVAAVLLCGALVAPLVYHIAQWFAEAVPVIAKQPFHRFVNRTMLATALIGLWPFARATGLNSFAALGLAGYPQQSQKFVTGFVIGISTVLAVAACALASGVRKLDPSLAGTTWLAKLLGIAATAAIVATIEEVLFRGALFGALRRVLHWAFALVVSSVLFAAAHFIQSGRIEGPVGWLSGFAVLGRMFEGFCHWQRVIPAFINLTLVGVALGVGYQRTGSLHFSIGLHAGWVFALKIYGWLTTPAAQASWVLCGTHKFIDGWLALAVLVGLCAVLWRRRPTSGRKDGYAQFIS